MRPAPHDAAAVFGVLREAFPSCFVFCAGRGDAAFVAASPELLVRREGMRASSLALAGSTRRSADPAVDDHLGEQLMQSAKDRSEQRIVVRAHPAERCAPHAVFTAAAPEPVLVKVANIQHLGTPIRAQLASPVPAVELAGHLHPTPAVGGEPLDVAAPLIPALEGLDRGWYAGPGGLDRRERGRRILRGAALRAAARPGRALLRGRRRGGRLRPGRRAGGDGDQARGAAARPGRVGSRPMTADADPLEQLSSEELHHLAVRYARRHLDLRFFLRLLERVPAAEAAAGNVAEAEDDIIHLSSRIDDLTEAGKGEVADMLRPFYLEYLREHGVTP